MGRYLIFISLPLFTAFINSLDVKSQVAFTNVAGERGLDHQFGISISTDPYAGGISFVDFDGDGWDDLLLTKRDVGQLFLYKNQNGYNFLLQTITLPGLSTPEQPIWLDYDNDGDKDIIVSQSVGGIRLYRQDPGFQFTDVSVAAGIDTTTYNYHGISCADINNDGYLDFYCSNFDITYTNRVYLSDQNGGFTEISNSCGANNGYCTTFGCVFFDLNKDGLQDIYIVNDHNFGNEIYKNIGNSTFVPIGSSSGGLVQALGMGATVGDIDDNGYLDFFAAAGPPHNFLYKNNGNETFTNFSDSSNVDVTNCHASWGANFFDVDLDMDLDLYYSDDDQTNLLPPTPSRIFLNGGSGVFDSTNVILADTHRSSANAIGDFNNDGLIDICVQNISPQGADLWENRTQTSNNWLKLILKGSVSNKDAIGSMVTAYVGNHQYIRTVQMGGVLLNQNSNCLTLASGDTCGFDSIHVRWPNGSDTTLYTIECSQIIELTEFGNAVPKATIMAVNGNNLCPNDTLRLAVPRGYDSILWSNGSTSDTIQVVAGGLYSVTVTNQYGYSSSASINIFPRSNPSFAINKTNPSCFGKSNGSVTMVPSAGQAGYSQVWENGATGVARVNLDTGSYSVTVTNKFGCKLSKSVLLEQPDSLEILLAGNDLSCFGDTSGSIITSVSGGTSPYEYYWSDAVFTSNRSKLNPGVYEVKVIDLRSCEASASVSIDQPSVLSAEVLISLIDSLPNTWNVIVNATGGVAPYSIEWSTDQSIVSFEAILTDSGKHYVKVYDSHECSVVSEFELNQESTHISNPVNIESTNLWYPNPATGIIRTKTADLLIVNLRDISGRLIASYGNVSSIDLDEFGFVSGQIILIETIRGSGNVYQVMVLSNH
ncbi:MAG: FG-GAP-like repeat-containing protein [Flavobacteriales bacterium]